MRRPFKSIFILSSLVLLLPMAALCQEAITAPQVLDSFAKIIRAKQYSCQKCNIVQPIKHLNNGWSYTATCNYNHKYEVLLTPQGDMVVEPILDKLLVSQ